MSLTRRCGRPDPPAAERQRQASHAHLGDRSARSRRGQRARPAWGYRYSLNHASLQLRVDDYALKSERQAYGVPHGVTLTLRDSAKGQLAVARSVEPLGYILAVHPNADIVNCEHRGIRPSSGNGSQGDYPRATSSTQPGPRPGHREFTAPKSVSAPANCVRCPSPSACRTTSGGSGGSRSRTLAGCPGNTSSSLSPLTAARARPLQPPRNHE
jgi:hypothetical protein